MSQNPIFSPPYFQHLAIQLSWDTGRSPESLIVSPSLWILGEASMKKVGRFVLLEVMRWLGSK